MLTRIVSVRDLTEQNLVSMYALMVKYYKNVSEEFFRTDLQEKQRVILLLSKDNIIRGFSTIVESHQSHQGKKFIALFSGDTVLEKEYWGNGALAMTFGRYIFSVKMRNPWTKTYWFLISKGYRTYLLMTNNFPIHYPRYEKKTPENLRQIMNHFYKSRFGTFFNAETGIVQFDERKCSALKESVADLDAELLRINPRICFFNSANQDWKTGAELACIAQVTLWIPFRYILKRSLRSIKPRPKLKSWNQHTSSL